MLAKAKSTSRREFALSETYRLEIDKIDTEHGLLIDILNDSLAEFDATGRAAFPDFEKYFRRLWQEMTVHFRHEEAEMRELQYPALLSHQHHHADVLNRLAALRDHAAARGYVDRTTIEQIFENIIADMLRADLGFKDFLARKVLLHPAHF